MLKPLSQIELPDLVTQNMVGLKDDIINKIKLNEDWDANWDGELYQNSFQMMILLYTFLFERNAESANTLIRELFLNQAFSPQAIYDGLNNMRVSAQQNTASAVTLTGLVINDSLIDPLVIPKFHQITATNKNNQSVIYELIVRDENTNEYNYYDNIVIYPNVSQRDHLTIEAYSGVTFSKQYEITPSIFENFKIKLNYTDIIEDSIQIYYITATHAPIKLLKSDTFIVEPVPMSGYFPNGIPHYIVKYNSDGSGEILFGTASFGGAFDSSHIGGYIEVWGRQGGGSSANILSGKISQQDVFNLGGGRTITIRFYNENDSAGGVDRENVYLAQTFAPYRYGRGKAIVDQIDAKSKLYSAVVKHEIDTPMYDDLQPTTQLLHAYHKIVPVRDFSAFILPDYATSDTLETYTNRFLSYLNAFCNVQGTHDNIVSGEDVTTFEYPDDNDNTVYDYMPTYKYPISASLRAYAYDYADRVVDSITWNCNYPVDQRDVGYSISTAPAEYTTIYSNAFDRFVVVNNITGRNDIVKIRFDYDIYPYTFELQVTTGTKTYIDYASELQALIIAKINSDVPALMGHLRLFQFVTSEQVDGSVGRIIFHSPSTGQYSKIEIVDNGTDETITNPQYNIYLYLGLETKIYRPSLETGLVFGSGSTFKYNDNIIHFIFRNDVYDKTVEKLIADLNININHTVVTGPLVEVQFTGENSDQLEQLFENGTLAVKAMNGSTVVDYMQFLNISMINDVSGTPGDGTEFGTPYTPGDVFKNVADNKYKYSTATATLRLHDNVVVTAYNQSYPTIYRVDIVKIIEVTPGVWSEDGTFTPLEFLEVDGNYTHDVTVETGKTVSISLTGEQNNTITVGDDFMVKIYHRDEYGNLILKESHKMLNIISDVNPFVDPWPGSEVCIDRVFAENQFTKTSGELKFKLLDGTEDTSTTYYDKGYATFTKLVFIYQRKSYDYVTIDYRPNPYRPEGEALALMQILGAKANRMIGLEQWIKSINFIPKGLSIQLVVKKNYSMANAITAVKDLIISEFSYSNTNYDHTIGSLMTHQEIKNIINTIATNYGIVNVVFNTTEETSQTSEDNYRFILDQTIYDQLRSLESRYSVLSGLSSMYKLDVTATQEGLA